MMHTRAGLICTGMACLLAVQAWGVQDAPEAAVFRTGVKLVQVSVIAQDKKGLAVGDLRREEFRVFDNGSAQEIRLFLAEKPVKTAVEALPPNVFTNVVGGDLGGGASGGSAKGGRAGYTVILFDNLVSGFGDPFTEDGTGYGAVKVVQVLKSIPEGEKIAIYAIGRKLQVVREFTSDRESLERQMRNWKPSPDDAVTGTDLCIGREEAVKGCLEVDSKLRLPSMNEELQQIAAHLAGVPGRKNLIWLANRFPISGGVAIQKLMDAGVAIYPVNEAGVKSLAGAIRSQEQLAKQTGGVAYYSRNDLDVAVREAMEDGRVSYTLGFYQPGEEKVARMHLLGVEVSRPGVTLRFKSTYLSEPAAKAPANPVAEMMAAMNRPMDATAMLLTARATRVAAKAGDKSGDRVDLVALLDVPSLDLVLKDVTSKEKRWSGKVEVVARFTGVDGNRVGEVFSQTVTLNLREGTYAASLAQGLPYHKELTIPAKAVELKLAVGNLASGAMGTLTIPLSEVRVK